VANQLPYFKTIELTNGPSGPPTNEPVMIILALTAHHPHGGPSDHRETDLASTDTSKYAFSLQKNAKVETPDW